MSRDTFYSHRRWRTFRAKLIAVWAQQYRPCGRCGNPIDYSLPGNLPAGPTVGHIIDRALGGADWDPANMRPEHRRCNSLAGAELGGKLAVAKKRSRGPSLNVGDGVQRHTSERW